MSDHYFLAFPVPDEIRDCLKTQSDRLRMHCTYRYWTDPRDLHVTFFFFGRLEPEQVRVIDHIMKSLAGETRPFSVSLSKIDGFGDQKHPRVVYAGFSDTGTLPALWQKAGDALTEHGFSIEKRPYRPHVTLAKKWSSGDPLSCRVSGVHELNLTWVVNQVVLYRVEPQSVPRYQPVKIFTFQS
ncbi:RNA 2',3'-cyclic phosphodiesterase [Sporolactobacillus sp. THM7-4]|nr:RNA 2',3'-cyclic phosphodiesterase [Sporolactobacillus sp. THM7-4]